MLESGNKGNIYKYENKKLILEIQKVLNSFKKIKPNRIKKIWPINEKEIAIHYDEESIWFEGNYSDYIFLLI